MIDVHIHIHNGDYTLEWIDRFVNQAIKMGLNEIFILEHTHQFVEFKQMYEQVCKYNKHQMDWYNRKFPKSLKEYTALIDKARKKEYPIKVKFGLEVCYFEDSEEFIRNITRSYHFDFVTGSVHWVNGFGFDHKEQVADNIDVDELYQSYYETMQLLIKSNLFTGVAHPDSIKCIGHYPSYDLTSTYEELASLLKEHNMYAEQSGGLALNYNTSLLGMNEKMLHIFLANDVQIMTASDAHRPEDVGANIKVLEQLLEE